MDALHEDLCTCLICRSLLLRMRNVSDKVCRDNLFVENHAVHEIMWKNILEPDRPQVAILRMRIAR